MNPDGTRVAVLTPYSPSGVVGGVEVFVDQLRLALGGVEVFAGAPGPAPTASRLFERIGTNLAYAALQASRAFVEKHRVAPFDIVIANGLSGWSLVFRRLRIPMVQVYHFTMAGLARKAIEHRGDRMTTGKVRAFFDGLSGYGKKIIAVSSKVLGEVEAYYGWHGDVIPNGVDTHLFRPLDRLRSREELGMPADSRIGLFVGRPEYAKGYDIFLQIARRMPDVTFVHIGPTDGRREPNVRALGRVSHDRMPIHYAAADFLVLPSRYEGFNLSILESLACGRPIVVSEAAYPFDEGQPRYGFIVKGPDPQGYVQSIRRVLHEPEALDFRESIEANYSLDVFARRWRRFTDVLVNG